MKDHEGVGTLVLFIVIIILFTFKGCQYDNLESKYNDLTEKYDDLEEQYYYLKDQYSSMSYDLEHYKERVWSFEDDFANVWCFFEDEEDVTFEEAKESFTRIHSLLSE